MMNTASKMASLSRNKSRREQKKMVWFIRFSIAHSESSFLNVTTKWPLSLGCHMQIKNENTRSIFTTCHSFHTQIIVILNLP